MAVIPDELTDEQVVLLADIASTGISGAESGEVPAIPIAKPGGIHLEQLVAYPTDLRMTSPMKAMSWQDLDSSWSTTATLCR